MGPAAVAGDRGIDEGVQGGRDLRGVGYGTQGAQRDRPAGRVAEICQPGSDAAGQVAGRYGVQRVAGVQAAAGGLRFRQRLPAGRPVPECLPELVEAGCGLLLAQGTHGVAGPDQPVGGGGDGAG